MQYLIHSAKGTTWKNHKYIKKENGRYIYPNNKSSSVKDKRTGITISEGIKNVAKDTSDMSEIASKMAFEARKISRRKGDKKPTSISDKEKKPLPGLGGKVTSTAKNIKNKITIKSAMINALKKTKNVSISSSNRNNKTIDQKIKSYIKKIDSNTGNKKKRVERLDKSKVNKSNRNNFKRSGRSFID